MPTADPVYNPPLGGELSVEKGGVPVASRPEINFIEGTGIALTVADDAANDQIDVTIEATGSGSGAPTNAQYVTLATHADLTVERVLTGSGRVSVTDGGAGSTVTLDIPDAGVTYAKVQNLDALSVLARSANSAGVSASVAATATSGAVLRESGSTIGWGTVAAAGLAADSVTTVKILDANVTAAKLATDAVETAKIKDVNVTTGKLADAAVTYAKFQNLDARSVFARAANSSGVGASVGGAGAATFVSDNGTSVAFRVVDTIPEDLALQGDISPAQLTGDVNDYDPTNNATATVIRLDSDATRTITGLAGGADGVVKLLLNIGSNSVVLAAASASSAAGNRFDIGTDRTIATKEGLPIWYDSTSSRWRTFTQAPGSGGGAPTDATYVCISTNGSLSAERTLAAEASVLTLTDAGANGAATIGVATNGITSAKFRQSAARSVVGVTGNATANVDDIQGTADQVLRVNAAGTALAFGTVAAGGLASDSVETAKILNANVTMAKIENGSARSVVARSANSGGVHASLQGGGANTFLSDDASTLAFRVVTTIPENFARSGDLSPAQITGNQNDYDPTNLATASILRLDLDAARTITGIAGGADGRILTLVNISAFLLTLSNADTGSSAANRFDFGRSLILMPKGCFSILYDSTSSRWRPAEARREATVDVVNVLTDGANISTNRDLGPFFTVTLGGNRTIDAPTGTLADGMFLCYRLVQDGTGSRTVTWASGAGAFEWTDTQTVPTLSTAASKRDNVLFVYDSTANRWRGFSFIKSA